MKTDLVSKEDVKELLLRHWDDPCTYAINCLDELPSAETYPTWHLVDKKLPKIGEIVLVKTKRNVPYRAKWTGKRWWKIGDSDHWCEPIKWTYLPVD